MFLALFYQTQDVITKSTWYTARMLGMSVGCTRIGVPFCAICAAPDENEQVMLETCRGP
jgi:hypothetical protein